MWGSMENRRRWGAVEEYKKSLARGRKEWRIKKKLEKRAKALGNADTLVARPFLLLLLFLLIFIFPFKLLAQLTVHWVVNIYTRSY